MNDNEEKKSKKGHKHNDSNNNLVHKAKTMPEKRRKKRKMILVDEKDPVGELPPPFPPRNIHVKEEDDMRDFYDIKKEIGRGRFGTVYLVEDKNTRQKFAAKFVKTRRNQDRANVEREVEIMKALNSEVPHPRLIQLYDAYDMEKEMCLVLEIVDGGELFERVINDDFVLTERACTVFVRQICEGVEFIHSKNILHLDMKPENILCLSREGNRVKICDFGLARRYDPRKKLQVLFGTPEFVAPEVVNFEPIGFGTDMWSVGVICYVLLSGLSPFMGHNYVETMTNVTHNKYDFDDEAFDSVSDEAKEFIQKLLVLDKSLRPTPAQCLRHTWLRTPPPPQFHPLQRRFPSSTSASEDEEEEEEEEETSEEEEEEEEEEKKKLEVIKVEEKIRVKEEETEKYSVRRRRREEEEKEKVKKKKEEEEEERKRKEMEEKRKDLERQIEEKKRRIAEEEEKCRKIREEEEEEEARRKAEEEMMRRRKKEEEEARRKEEERRREEEEARRREEKRREEEEARRKEEERKRKEEEEARRKEEEERRKREEEEARRKMKEEERRKREEEEARRKEEEEARRKREKEEARRKEEEEEVRRRKVEAERRRKEEEETKRRIEEEKIRKEEEEKKRKEAEEKRRREAEEKRRKEVEEKKRKEAEKLKREAEEKQKAEERRKREEEEKKKNEAEEKKRKTAEDNKRKEGKERRREGELERSKAQLRDFVARWSAHPNSPYVVVAGSAPRGLDAARVNSGASLTSLAALPPSDLSPDDLDDEDEAGTAGEDEEFVHYTITAPYKGAASPPEVARHLEARLKQLQQRDATEEGKAGGKSRGKGSGKSGGRGEKRRSSSGSPSSRVLQDSERAEAIIEQILNSDHRSAYQEYQRMVGASPSGQLRRPELVALQQDEGGGKRRSRNASPTRQPRRQPSRDVPREDRPPSRDGDHSPTSTHRRPSRDVPLSPSQMDRIARAAAGGAAPQAWPDLIVAPQGEADEEVRQFSLDVPVASLLKSPSGTLRSVPGLKVSPEPEADATPTHRPSPTHKGAPSLTPPPSPPSENYSKPGLSSPPSPTPAHKAPAPTPSPVLSSATDSKPALTPPPSPTPSHKDASASEDAPSRLVAWILDIGTRTPPRQNSSTSLQDRVTEWETRDGCARPSHSPSPRLSPSPRPSPSSSPSRKPHERSPKPAEGRKGEEPASTRRPQPPFSLRSSENPTTEKVIQTPWGAFKRSPSKTSLSKSPSREREPSPASRGKAASPVRTALQGGQGHAPQAPSPREAAPARQRESTVAWAPGGKSHTLPRSAKLMRQKSMGSVPGGVDATHLDLDGSLKRKSKFPPAPSPNKRPLAPLLFTAQDRISMFEKQQPSSRGPPRPLARTRSSVTLGGSASSDPRAGECSQVGFMKTRLLGKARHIAAPSLPEEPSSPDPARQPGPDAA